MKLTMYIDGGSRGNPGPAATGLVLHREGKNDPLVEEGSLLGKATNNVAEYTALIRGLERVVQLGATSVKIHSDSELMVKQITGEYRVKSAELQPLYEQAQMLLLQLDQWQIKHVKRELNRRADELVNMALDQKEDVVMTWPDQADLAPDPDAPAEPTSPGQSKPKAKSGGKSKAAASKAAASKAAASKADIERIADEIEFLPADPPTAIGDRSAAAADTGTPAPFEIGVTPHEDATPILMQGPHAGYLLFDAAADRRGIAEGTIAILELLNPQGTRFAYEAQAPAFFEVEDSGWARHAPSARHLRFAFSNHLVEFLAEDALLEITRRSWPDVLEDVAHRARA